MRRCVYPPIGQCKYYLANKGDSTNVVDAVHDLDTSAHKDATERVAAKEDTLSSYGDSAFNTDPECDSFPETHSETATSEDTATQCGYDMDSAVHTDPTSEPFRDNEIEIVVSTNSAPAAVVIESSAAARKAEDDIGQVQGGCVKKKQLSELADKWNARAFNKTRCLNTNAAQYRWCSRFKVMPARETAQGFAAEAPPSKTEREDSSNHDCTTNPPNCFLQVDSSDETISATNPYSPQHPFKCVTASAKAPAKKVAKKLTKNIPKNLKETNAKAPAKTRVTTPVKLLTKGPIMISTKKIMKSSTNGNTKEATTTPTKETTWTSMTLTTRASTGVTTRATVKMTTNDAETSESSEPSIEGSPMSKRLQQTSMGKARRTKQEREWRRMASKERKELRVSLHALRELALEEQQRRQQRRERRELRQLRRQQRLQQQSQQQQQQQQFVKVFEEESVR